MGAGEQEQPCSVVDARAALRRRRRRTGGSVAGAAVTAVRVHASSDARCRRKQSVRGVEARGARGARVASRERIHCQRQSRSQWQEATRRVESRHTSCELTHSLATRLACRRHTPSHVLASFFKFVPATAVTARLARHPSPPLSCSALAMLVPASESCPSSDSEDSDSGALDLSLPLRRRAEPSDETTQRHSNPKKKIIRRYYCKSHPRPQLPSSLPSCLLPIDCLL